MLTRCPNGPHPFELAAFGERNGAEIDEQGEPDIDDAADSCPSESRLRPRMPAVIRTREWKWTRGLEP